MKSVTGTRKDTASAEHHYFPRALQKFWRDDGGWVWRLSADGKLDRSKNGTFGHLRNAHRIKLADEPSPWDESFEYTFRKPDGSIPRVVELLSQVEAPVGVENNDWRRRLAPQWQLQEDRAVIAELVASLVVRSPSVRNILRLTVSDFFEGAGPWPNGEVPGSIISYNQRPLLECYSKALAERGKFAIAVSDHREFVFGDGVLHNFHGGVISPNNPRCLVPITPSVAVAYACPMSYTRSADFVAFRLSPAEIDEVNLYTQVYSGKHLYFRSELPSDLTPFKIGKHQQVQYNSTPWFDDLMHVVANTWF